LANFHSHPCIFPSRHFLLPCLFFPTAAPRSLPMASSSPLPRLQLGAQLLPSATMALDASPLQAWQRLLLLPSILLGVRSSSMAAELLSMARLPCSPATPMAASFPLVAISPALPLQASSNFGQQRTATPLSQLGLAITQGMAGAQKIHAAGPLPPCAQLSFLLRSISLPQAPARAQQRIPSALPCSSSLPHKTAAARPTSPRCAAPRRNAAVPAAPTPSLASSLLTLRACHVFGDLSKWGVEQ
jgi:hypothetical protein